MVFFLAIVISQVIFTGFIHLNKPVLMSDKDIALLPDVKSLSLQENAKYHYVGMEKCATVCHNNDTMGFQFDIMKNGPHSNAFKILASKKAVSYSKKADIKGNPQESLACLKCHITGADLDSSFFAPTYKKEEGVTCEACHKGPFITKAFIPKEENCLKCHNDSVHRISKFNYRENCEKIAHPRPKVKPKDT